MSARLIVTPEVERWRARCPLRGWLDHQPRGEIQKLMVATGVTRQAVYAWMDGVCLPSLPRMRKLERITRISFDQWEKWWSKRPTPENSHGVS